MTRDRLILILACVIGVAVAGALLWRAGVFRPAPPPAAVGGPFNLVDQDGRPATQDVLKGQWSAVFFGFTYCPDVCPATLQALGSAADRLGPKARDLQVVFISVDPARDTPAQLKAYLAAQNLPVKTIGLTGSDAQVAAAAKAYKVYYAKDGSGPDYSINHSTAAYLMDPKGRFVRVLAYGLTPEQMAELIAKSMRGE